MHFHPFAISQHFTVDSALLALLGGVVLGSTVLFKTFLTGQVLGISGITRGALKNPLSFGKLAFLLGILLAGPLMGYTFGNLEPMLVVDSPLLKLRLFLGAVMVGAGSAWGNGCTSGHGLTGLARLSLRSWLAVPTFMGMAVIAATFAKTAEQLPPHAESEDGDALQGAAAAGVVVTGLLLWAAVALALRKFLDASKALLFVEFGGGLAFGCGLVISGMARPSKVAAFLDLGSGAWDPSLPFVMAAALAVTFPFFTWLQCKATAKPLLAEDFDMPARTKNPDKALMLGAVVFGVGWGVAGACPGPIWVLLLGRLSVEALLLWLGMIVGIGAWVLVDKRQQASSKACTTCPEEEAEAVP